MTNLEEIKLGMAVLEFATNIDKQPTGDRLQSKRMPTIRSDNYQTMLRDLVEAQGMTLAEAVAVIGISQTRVSVICNQHNIRADIVARIRRLIDVRNVSYNKAAQILKMDKRRLAKLARLNELSALLSTDGSQPNPNYPLGGA